MIARAFALLLLAGTLHAAKAPDWVRFAAAQPVPAQPPGTVAVVLSDTTSIAFDAPDVLTTHRRRVVKILTPAGREYATGAAVFDDRTSLRMLRGWSIDADGNVQSVRERDAIESTAASYEVFTDAKWKSLDLPSEPGGIVAYEYETRERVYEPVSVWRFQERIPVLAARLDARLPAGWQYQTTWMHYEPVEALTGPVWQLRNVPAIANEPRMPPSLAVAGRLGVQWRGARSWKDVGSWFDGLSASRADAGAPVRRKARELADGAADPVQALARFAQREIRYVAVEIGIGGYQPHAASDVFANRFGDCKDKATLLRAMLAEIGVPSYSVLVHTARGVVEPSFPSVQSFNHVIAAIRIPREAAGSFDAVIDHPHLGALLLFDPTSATTRFGQLPTYLQNSRGLLVVPHGGELVELPSNAPDASTLHRRATLRLDDAGTLSGKVEEVRTGAIAADLREYLLALNAVERVRWVDSLLGVHLVRHTATDVKFENLDDPEKDLVVRYTLVAPGYATRAADLLLVRPRVIGSKGERPVSTAERKLDYVTEGPSLQTDEVEIAVPPSIALDELPTPMTLSTPVVEYASESAFANGVLRFTRRYAMKTHGVARASIPSMNAAFTKIAADERASAVFK